jgi:hypothetical protein
VIRRYPGAWEWLECRSASPTDSVAQTTASPSLLTGECELFPDDDDVGGLAVHIGARISSLAGPGEVLVSSTVRDLSVGSGQTLSDRGEHDLKGVPGTWRILAVEM